MLSWKKTHFSTHQRMTDPEWSHVAKTSIGTAVIHEAPDGTCILDMWKPDQTNIGRGNFLNVDMAKTRAETILDPRATCWDMVNAWCDDEDLHLDETG